MPTLPDRTIEPAPGLDLSEAEYDEMLLSQYPEGHEFIFCRFRMRVLRHVFVKGPRKWIEAAYHDNDGLCRSAWFGLCKAGPILVKTEKGGFL